MGERLGSDIGDRPVLSEVDAQWAMDTEGRICAAIQAGADEGAVLALGATKYWLRLHRANCGKHPEYAGPAMVDNPAQQQ